MGSNCKYEYKEDLETIVLDRVLFTSMVYPANYGFVLQTEGKDGDPLDVLVFSSVPINPGIVVKCRAIGIAIIGSGEEAKRFLKGFSTKRNLKGKVFSREIEHAKKLAVQYGMDYGTFDINRRSFEEGIACNSKTNGYGCSTIKVLPHRIFSLRVFLVLLRIY